MARPVAPLKLPRIVKIPAASWQEVAVFGPAVVRSVNHHEARILAFPGRAPPGVVQKNPAAGETYGRLIASKGPCMLRLPFEGRWALYNTHASVAVEVAVYETDDSTVGLQRGGYSKSTGVGVNVSNAAASTVLTENVDAEYRFIQNVGTNVVFIAENDTPVATGGSEIGFRLSANGGFYERCSDSIFRGIIKAISLTGSSRLYIVEGV